MCTESHFELVRERRVEKETSASRSVAIMVSRVMISAIKHTELARIAASHIYPAPLPIQIP
jgi:hypothetical protein